MRPLRPRPAHIGPQHIIPESRIHGAKKSDLESCSLALHYEWEVTKYHCEMLKQSNATLQREINTANAQYTGLKEAFDVGISNRTHSDSDLRALNSSLKIINKDQADKIVDLESRLTAALAKMRTEKVGDNLKIPNGSGYRI